MKHTFFFFLFVILLIPFTYASEGVDVDGNTDFSFNWGVEVNPRRILENIWVRLSDILVDSDLNMLGYQILNVSNISVNNITAYTHTVTFNEDITVTGNVTAGSFFGDGTNITNAGLWERVGGQSRLKIPQTINMQQRNITNISQLQAQDGSAIKFGDSGIFTGIDQAINFQTNQTLGEGVVTHVLTDLQGQKVIEAWQSGKNNSAGFHRNSYLIFNDTGSQNSSILTNAPDMWMRIGIEPFLAYDSADTGADLGVQDGIEAQQIFIHDDLGRGNFFGSGLFRWIGRAGNDIDLYEAAIHIKQDRIEEIGLDAGESTIVASEDFDGATLGIFYQVTTGGGASEWGITSNVDCPEGVCANANGGGAGTDRIMETNVSMNDINNSNLSFIYSIDEIGVTLFNVTVNNNTGSGDVELYTDNADIINQQVVVGMPPEFNNASKVSVRFHWAGTNPANDDVYVNNFVINGTAMVSTLANITVEDAKIELGNGQCNIELNGSGNQTLLIGGEFCGNVVITNATFTSVTQQSLNVTDNISANNFIAREGFEFDDTNERITDWDNVSQFDEDIFLTDGSRIMNFVSASLNFTRTSVFPYIVPNAVGTRYITLIEGEIFMVANLADRMGFSFSDGAGKTMGMNYFPNSERLNIDSTGMTNPRLNVTMNTNINGDLNVTDDIPIVRIRSTLGDANLIFDCNSPATPACLINFQQNGQQIWQWGMDDSTDFEINHQQLGMIVNFRNLTGDLEVYNNLNVTRGNISVGEFFTNGSAFYTLEDLNRTGGVNPFDQDLNTFDNVTFNNMTLTGNLTVLGNYTKLGAFTICNEADESNGYMTLNVTQAILDGNWCTT